MGMPSLQNNIILTDKSALEIHPLRDKYMLSHLNNNVDLGFQNKDFFISQKQYMQKLLEDYKKIDMVVNNPDFRKKYPHIPKDNVAQIVKATDKIILGRVKPMTVKQGRTIYQQLDPFQYPSLYQNPRGHKKHFLSPDRLAIHEGEHAKRFRKTITNIDKDPSKPYYSNLEEEIVITKTDNPYGLARGHKARYGHQDGTGYILPSTPKTVPIIEKVLVTNPETLLKKRLPQNIYYDQPRQMKFLMWGTVVSLILGGTALYLWKRRQKQYEKQKEKKNSQSPKLIGIATARTAL